MLRFVGRLLAAGIFMIAANAQAQVVVSQVYGGGGNAGATFRSDFIELHNNGTTAVSLTGWSVQYASSTGTSWNRTNLSGSIAAGGYYLVKQADGAGGTVSLPTPDATGTIAMSGTAGKIALVNNQTTLTGSCPLGGAVVDFVGFGSANCSETAPTPAPSNTLAVLRAGNGCTDSGNNSTDFATGTPNPRNSASAVQVCGATTPVVAINDVSVFEGDSGTVDLVFGIGLSQPADVGGVSVQLATADGTAAAGSDYTAASTTVTIPEGSNSTTFTVSVIGDTTPESNETFFVNIVSATGANIADDQGVGTIQNDDVAVVQIHDIQGNGLTSPINGATVTTEGIVTALKFNNGFFLQSTTPDADPNTSEGIFVFTSTAPPATAAVGNRIRVTGTVTEFTPSTNLNQLSITEIVSVTAIQVLSTGNPLPAPVDLTAADFSAASVPGTAEKYEGMRVRIAEARVISGSDGNISESSANSSTTGVFHVVLPTVQRPFREPGIGILDNFPIPGGKTPPRFDTNQERLMVRSRGQVGATSLALDADAQIADMTGVMDYFSGTWALLPDVGSGTATGGKTPTAVADAGPEDVTIGGFNLLRFFDEVNDSNGAPTLTAAALDKRLTKTSLAICDFVKAPDILGVVEVENLRVLGLLADRINATCARAPQYVPYLIDGNDVGGINVGFLVSTRLVGANPRVEVLEVTQFGKNTVFTNPNGSTSLLNDRPPLLLRAIVHGNGGATYPVTAIVNHLRSLNGIDDTAAGSSGWPTEGDRVRAKRLQQAVFLADLVQARQVADPAERIILLGDFNAFEFSDGYADVMGVIRGDAAPENEVIAFAPSPITRPLIDGSELIPAAADRYSYVFEGSAQTLDHVVLNEPMIMDAADIVVDHARINADFGVHNYGVAGNAIRVSDHDPVRVAISVAAFRSMDLVAGAAAVTANVNLGETASFDASIRNDGPSEGGPVSIAMVFDALVTPAVSPPGAEWTCAAPTQTASTTTVTCTAASLVAGIPANFMVDVPTTDPTLANRSLRMDVAVSSTIEDPANANNQASASANVEAFADMEVAAGGPAGPIQVGATANFTADVNNAGPQAAPFASLALVFDALIAPTVTAPAGWTCAAPVQDATTTTVTCTIPSLASGSGGQFGIAIPTGGPQQSDWTLQMAAAVSSQLPDPDNKDNTAIATAQIQVFADLDAVIATSTPTIDPGQTALLTSSLTNNGPASVANVTGTFTFNALVAPTVTAPAGWTCAAPTQTATSTSVVCTTASLAAGAQPQFAIGFVAGPALADSSVTVTAAMSAAIADPFPGNNQASAVVNVRAFADADLAITATTGTPGVVIGGTAAYVVTLRNNGPAISAIANVGLSFNAVVSPTVAAPAGWTCDAPVQTATVTTVTCSTTDFAASASAQFNASFVAGAALDGRTVTLTATAVSSENDPVAGNDQASASVQIASSADLSVRMIGRSERAGVFLLAVNNAGPSAAQAPTLTLTGNMLPRNVVLVPAAGWTCTTTAVGTGFSSVCNASGPLAAGADAYFGLALAGRGPQSVTVTATVASVTADPNTANNTTSRVVRGNGLPLQCVHRYCQK